MQRRAWKVPGARAVLTWKWFPASQHPPAPALALSNAPTFTLAPCPLLPLSSAWNPLTSSLRGWTQLCHLETLLTAPKTLVPSLCRWAPLLSQVRPVTGRAVAVATRGLRGVEARSLQCGLEVPSAGAVGPHVEGGVLRSPLACWGSAQTCLGAPTFHLCQTKRQVVALEKGICS